jgi:hypothetical protein
MNGPDFKTAEYWRVSNRRRWDSFVALPFWSSCWLSRALGDTRQEQAKAGDARGGRRTGGTSAPRPGFLPRRRRSFGRRRCSAVVAPRVLSILQRVCWGIVDDREELRLTPTIRLLVFSSLFSCVHAWRLAWAVLVTVEIELIGPS